MRKIFTLKKIRTLFLAFVVLLNSTISNAQFIEKWVSNGSGSLGALPPVKGVVLITTDCNIISAGTKRVSKHTPAGEELWFADFTFPTSSHSSVRAIALATDLSGNIYLTGVQGANENINFGDIDILIAKYSPDGKEIWSRIYDGPAGIDDESVGIATDQSGNVYLAGNTYVDQQNQRIHTVKFNTDGTLQWAVTYNDASFSRATALAVDFFTGDVFVAGSSLVPRVGDDIHLSDFTTIKYNINGEQQWLRLYNGGSGLDDVARAVVVDADGNVLVTGSSIEKNKNTVGGTNNEDVFSTFKYDRVTGREIWHKKYGKGESEGGSTFNNIANAIAVDADGNAVVTGTGHLTTDGSTVGATIKYRKADGEAIWDKIFDNEQFVPKDVFDDDQDAAFGVAVDGVNNVYVTGSSKGNETGKDFFTIKYRASNGSELGRARYDNGIEDVAVDLAVDAVGNVYITGNAAGFTTIKYGLCTIICPQNITVSNESGKCSAVVNFEATTSGDCGPLVFLEGEDTVSSGDTFSVGQHNIVVRSESTGESCSFLINVIDNEKPVITQCAADLTVSCAANVPTPDTSLIKTTDNCEVVTISHAGDVITNQTCANRFTLTRTYMATDSHGNTATCTQVITVNDTVPPRITGFSLSKESLFPPNHKMQDITLNYDVTDNCVSNPPVTITIVSNEPVNGTGDGDTDPDWIVIDAHHIQLRAERSALGNGRIYTITVTADDGCNPPVSVTRQVVVAHNITGPQSGNPFKIGSIVNLTGVFWDKPGSVHTAKWLMDSSVVTGGTVTEPSGLQNGKVTGSYKFNTAGVYKLQMNLIDQAGNVSYANTNGDLESIVVIYDPNGGNVYGGGWFNSAAGALTGNPSASGKASYGFTVNYKNAAKPKGETQFEFKVGSFEFNALNFDYLAIKGATAQFKGTGKITGGQSGIGFTMTVTDGALDGTGVDKIRMKVYNRNTGAVIYDNQPGASDAALPATTVGANSLIVIQGNNVSAAAITKQESLAEEKAVGGLEVTAFPNPTNNYFALTVSGKATEKIMMQVFDQNGRIVETRQNIISGSIIRFGDKFRSGAYFVRIIQGDMHKEIKLIKIAK